MESVLSNSFLEFKNRSKVCCGVSHNSYIFLILVLGTIFTNDLFVKFLVIFLNIPTHINYQIHSSVQSINSSMLSLNCSIEFDTISKSECSINSTQPVNDTISYSITKKKRIFVFLQHLNAFTKTQDVLLLYLMVLQPLRHVFSRIIITVTILNNTHIDLLAIGKGTLQL